MKKFNITGACVPEKHFMVDILSPVLDMVEHVYSNDYIVIDRPPKCGKTTMLKGLEKWLKQKYAVISINARHITPTGFESESNFCAEFIKLATKTHPVVKAHNDILSDKEKNCFDKWNDWNIRNLDSLSSHINEMCESEKTVLIIDDADISIKKEYYIFRKFIEMLEKQQKLSRENKINTFQSVILAGVGNMGDKESHEQIYNSPVSTNSEVILHLHMSFIAPEIEKMLDEYEMCYNTGMNAYKIACEIYNHTGGHPLLISKICHCMHEKFDNDWTSEGIQKAVNLINIYAAHNINSFI